MYFKSTQCRIYSLRLYYSYTNKTLKVIRSVTNRRFVMHAISPYLQLTNLSMDINTRCTRHEFLRFLSVSRANRSFSEKVLRDTLWSAMSCKWNWLLVNWNASRTDVGDFFSDVGKRELGRRTEISLIDRSVLSKTLFCNTRLKMLDYCIWIL